MKSADITLAIQNAASRFAPAALYEAALADGCEATIELGIDDVIHGASDVMDQIDEYEDMIEASSHEVVGRLPLDLGSYTIDLPPRNAEDAVDPPLYGDGPGDGMRLMAFLQG